jgi:putative FmdB family regulatory protein
MPTYIYKCEKCLHLFEAFHTYKERLQDCPECEEKNVLKKQLNTPVQLIHKPPQKKQKPGEVVKEEIRKNKEEIQKQSKEYREGKK